MFVNIKKNVKTNLMFFLFDQVRLKVFFCIKLEIKKKTAKKKYLLDQNRFISSFTGKYFTVMFALGHNCLDVSNINETLCKLTYRRHIAYVLQVSFQLKLFTYLQ